MKIQATPEFVNRKGVYRRSRTPTNQVRADVQFTKRITRQEEEYQKIFFQ